MLAHDYLTVALTQQRNTQNSKGNLAKTIITTVTERERRTSSPYSWEDIHFNVISIYGKSNWIRNKETNEIKNAIWNCAIWKYQRILFYFFFNFRKEFLKEQS